MIDLSVTVVTVASCFGDSRGVKAIQVLYNLQKTCRLLAAVVKNCIAVVLRLCGHLQYNKIFVILLCIVVILHLCEPP